MAENVGSIIGNSVGEAAAFAAGLAIGPVLAPVLRALENETWSAYPDKPMDAQSAAQGVAEGKWDLGAGQNEALNTGFGTSVFPMLVDLFKTAPSLAQAFDLIRRGQMQPTELPLVIQRLALEDHWTAFVQALSATGLSPWEQPLSPADIALGLIRGNMTPQPVNGEPMFPPGGDSSGSIVPHDPVSDLDVIAEAEASGISPERMAILARNVGLPPGVIEGLNMLNRGIIDVPSFYLLIEQSDARLSWGPFLLQLRRLLLTPHDYVEARLRNWITSDAEMYAGTALHGLTQGDTDLLYLITGRPISYRNVFLGQRRGGVYNGPVDAIDQVAVQSMRESNLRPEWYSLAGALLETKPTLFFVRSWLKDGHDPAQARTWLYELGYSASDIDAIITAYAPGAATGGPNVPDTHLKSSITSTITAIRKKYAAGDLTPDIANQYIAAAEGATTLTGVWDVLKSVESVAAPPPQPAPAALIAAVEALGYNVTPPAPPIPAEVSELEALGYTVTPK